MRLFLCVLSAKLLSINKRQMTKIVLHRDNVRIIFSICASQNFLFRQGRQAYDFTQLTRDLRDAKEREKDLEEQNDYITEESRLLRKKLMEIECENEALREQLNKLSIRIFERQRELPRGTFIFCRFCQCYVNGILDIIIYIYIYYIYYIRYNSHCWIVKNMCVFME